ncbi:MAG: hypothetical protein RIS76_2538 [Verrucomicrobiota bacterium]|jgi:hypothetical protein
MNGRFRKSISLGKGVRVTGSKSGMGMSWGFPGFRIGKSVAGEWAVTVGIPKTGIAFRQVVWKPGEPKATDVEKTGGEANHHP